MRILSHNYAVMEVVCLVGVRTPNMCDGGSVAVKPAAFI